VTSLRPIGVTAGVVAAAAWGGAIGLVTGSLDLTAPIERKLPFRSPVFGGVALAVVVAVPCTVTTWLALRRDRRAARVAEASGWLLVAWIAVQIALIRTFNPLQPICAALGGLLVLLGRRARRSSAGVPGPEKY
jgi:hypothetical protein